MATSCGTVNDIAFLVLKFTKLEWDDVLVGWMVSITIIITISFWGAHKI